MASGKNPSEIDRFKRWRPPQVKKPVVRPDERRLSPRQRGYDKKWQKVSEAYRRKHPFCEECERQGRDTLGDLVDHIIPIRHAPKLRLAEENFQTLCHHCHNTWKAKLERTAERMHMLDMLPVWCREPKKRPNERVRAVVVPL